MRVRWLIASGVWLIATAVAAGCGSSGSSTGSGGAASGGGGSGGSGGSATGGTGGVDCNCTLGAYVAVCGVDGKTYDATCGTVCVPVQIACSGECPCPDAGTPSCGDAGFCLQGAACVEVHYAPNCTPLSDVDAGCPTGQTMSFCGGAGGACCCDAPPPNTYSCQPCAGAVDCSCVQCPPSKMCTPSASGSFICEDPPVP
jgi:hypothetical protein